MCFRFQFILEDIFTLTISVSFSRSFHFQIKLIIPRQQKANFFLNTAAASQTTDGGGGKWKNSERKMKGSSSSSGTRKRNKKMESSEGKMFNGESCQRIFAKENFFFFMGINGGAKGIAARLLSLSPLQTKKFPH